MGPQYVELERDLTLLLWLDISMNYNLSQKVYTADCMSILSERTFRFLTLTKALIGNQHKYSLLAGLQLVKFHGLNCCTMLIRLRSLAVPWATILVACFLESSLKDKLKKPSKRINGHLHRVQHDIFIFILMCSQESWQFGLVLPDRYCSLWSMPQYSVEQTCCLWMSSRSMEKEMATQRWYCHLIYAVTVMTVRSWLRTTVIIQLGDIQEGAQKVG